VIILPPPHSPLQAADHVGFPAVIKPIHGAASLGVLRVDSRESLATAYDKARRSTASPDLCLCWGVGRAGAMPRLCGCRSDDSLAGCCPCAVLAGPCRCARSWRPPSSRTAWCGRPPPRSSPKPRCALLATRRPWGPLHTSPAPLHQRVRRTPLAAGPQPPAALPTPACLPACAQAKGLSASCLMEEYLDGPEVDVDLVFSQGEPVCELPAAARLPLLSCRSPAAWLLLSARRGGGGGAACCRAPSAPLAALESRQCEAGSLRNDAFGAQGLRALLPAPFPHNLCSHHRRRRRDRQLAHHRAVLQRDWLQLAVGAALVPAARAAGAGGQELQGAGAADSEWPGCRRAAAMPCLQLSLAPMSAGSVAKLLWSTCLGCNIQAADYCFSSVHTRAPVPAPPSPRACSTLRASTPAAARASSRSTAAW
jgi:hypothetical protein